MSGVINVCVINVVQSNGGVEVKQGTRYDVGSWLHNRKKYPNFGSKPEIPGLTAKNYGLYSQ